MNYVLAFIGGAALGVVVAGWFVNPSSCCKVVTDGVRDEIADRFGARVASVGDALNVWRYTAGLAGLAKGA